MRQALDRHTWRIDKVIHLQLKKKKKKMCMLSFKEVGFG
jgi:hypothetical protein